MTKEELYTQIMENISKVVKQTLDETLTTFPFEKIKNYIKKLETQLDITITKEKKLNNNVPDILLNDKKFDDMQLDIIKNDKSNFNKEEKEIIDNKLQLIGYKYLTRYMLEEQEHLLYAPNMQNTIAYNNFESMEYLYHICPKYVVNKIKENGFCPKSKNSVFSYDPRIHFLYGNIPYIQIRYLASLLDSKNNSKGNNHQYCLIKIKRPNNIKFYKDLDSQFGIFTKENISSKYIEEISDIELLSFTELLQQNLFKLNL